MPRLLAVDLDGTLLDRSGRPHAVDVQALKRAVSAGVVVSILTGRLHSGTKAAAREAGLVGPLGCADGSHLVLADGATLRHSALPRDSALRLRDGLDEHQVATFLFAQDTIHHDGEGDDFLHYVSTWSPNLERAKDVHAHDRWTDEHGVTAVVGVADEARIARLVTLIREELPHSAQVLSFPLGATGRWAFLTRSSGVDKGTALDFIAQHSNVARGDTVVVGDWLNDLPMFRAAGRSYAMGQAPAHVKDAATHVLDETAEQGGGIARVVKDLFGL
jgi:hypothetical protein